MRSLPRSFTAFLACALVMMAAAILIDRSIPARASFPGSNGKIAYITGGSNNDVWTMNADGTGAVNITNSSDYEDSLSWSADGAKIAFARDPSTGLGIWTMNANGSNQIQLTSISPGYEGMPTWSPDGTKIAFSSARPPASGGGDIFVMNANGTGITQLTTTNSAEVLPAWSPDGSKIVYQSFGGSQSPGIYVMNANGTAQTPLAVGAEEGINPDWSPDGLKVVYLRMSDIWIMNANGLGKTKLTNFGDVDLAAWSPDSTDIAFSRSSAIYTMNTDGTGVMLRKDVFPALLYWFDWQPSGPKPPTPTPTPQAVGGSTSLTAVVDAADHTPQRAMLIVSAIAAACALCAGAFSLTRIARR